MKFKIFPEEFDPVKAHGPPSAEYLRFGISWTEEETAYHRELEKQFKIIEFNSSLDCPKNRFNMKVED